MYFLNMQTAGLPTLHKGSIITSSHLRSGGWGCLRRSCLSKGLGLGYHHLLILSTPAGLSPLSYMNNVTQVTTSVCNHFSLTLYFPFQSFFFLGSPVLIFISREARGQSRKIIFWAQPLPSICHIMHLYCSLQFMKHVFKLPHLIIK